MSQDLQAINAMIADLSTAEHSECRRCHEPIIPSGYGTWLHVAHGNVGCRAASFVPGVGWNDDLPRHWKAAPVEPKT